MRKAFVFLLTLLLAVGSAQALEWISIAPNPAYSRDLAMGASTVALSYAPQSQSINPAGLTLFSSRTPARATLFVNPGGLYHVEKSWEENPKSSSGIEKVADGARVLAGGAALQVRIATVALLLSQPVQDFGDNTRYRDYEEYSPLGYHQNSLVASFALHPRISIGGRVDRYFSFDRASGDGYSYGVIFRPRGVSLGIQYQRFPLSGARVTTPLDRRSDQSTTAGLAVERGDLTFSMQVMNLTRSDAPAFVEPHAGVEWRPLRALALRAGGAQFSRSNRWAWTSGIGLLDANWFRKKANRLMVPDDVLQAAVGVIYDKRTPVLGMGSLTLAWRF